MIDPGDLVKTEIIIKEETLDTGEDEVDCLPQMTEDFSATGSSPTTDSWPGSRDFRFEIEDFQKAYGSKGRGYTYSKMLNKLFIEMGKPVAVRFFVTGAKDSDQIRALPVYTSISARSEPVVRCPIHAQPSDQSNTGVEVEMCQHLVRCQETGPGGARYQEDSTTGRLSVVTRVKETAPGCDYFTVIYQFMCLGSCPGGLARRPINVIWSLETGSGEVVGRQSLEVRICTCPFRDQQQEETRAQRCSIQASLVQSKILNKHTPKKPADDDDNTSDTKNDGQLYYVPVRGLENFHKVNKFAEYLDLTDGGELMTEEAVLRRKTRTSLVLESNPGLSEQMLSESSGAKKRKLMQIQSQCEPSTTILKQSVPYRILRQAPLSQQTGTTRIIRPSSASSLHIPVQVLRPTSPRSSLKSNLSTPATRILALPRLPVSKYNVSGPNSSTTVVLPPRPPLGQGTVVRPVVKEEATVNDDEDEEGVDQPDSLGIYDESDNTNEAEEDGLAAFRRTISS